MKSPLRLLGWQSRHVTYQLCHMWVPGRWDWTGFGGSLWVWDAPRSQPLVLPPMTDFNLDPVLVYGNRHSCEGSGFLSSVSWTIIRSKGGLTHWTCSWCSRWGCSPECEPLPLPDLRVSQDGFLPRGSPGSTGSSLGPCLSFFPCWCDQSNLEEEPFGFFCFVLFLAPTPRRQCIYVWKSRRRKLKPRENESTHGETPLIFSFIQSRIQTQGLMLPPSGLRFPISSNVIKPTFHRHAHRPAMLE